MHSTHSKVVEVIMGKHYSANQHSNYPTQIKVLSSNVAEDTEKIGYYDLRNFTIHKESKFPKHEGTNDS